MKNWLDQIPTLPADLPPFYDDGAARARSCKTGLAADRRLARRADRRALLDLRQVADAAAALARLPEAGESFHIVSAGNWPAWALVPAILRLAPGQRIARLSLATLGFSRANVEALCNLLDAGEIKAASLLFSVYFRSTDATAAEFAVQMLEQRGQHVAALRIHAKIILAELDDGRAFTIESSANLRSCGNVEQFVVTQDRDLFQFHAAWMADLLAQAAKEVK